MKLNLFLLVCLSGLLQVSVSILRTVPHKYELIMTSMTWPDAQNYCRLKYNDLATILSDTDWLRLNTEAESNNLTTPVWAGLYKDIYNWRWSLNDIPLKNVPFSNWYIGFPDNTTGSVCGCIGQRGYWWNPSCTGLRPFVCYSANVSDANKFIGISSPTLSWQDALTYCRTHYTDLASSLNSSDQNMLVQVWNKQSDSWFGVHREMDTWSWSDGTNALNIPWYPGQPDNRNGIENCAVVNNGYFYDEPCTNMHNFFCETITPMRGQIMRLQVESDGSVFVPAVQSSILGQIKQKLKDNNMLQNTTVSWRIQSDGNIFNKEKKR